VLLNIGRVDAEEIGRKVYVGYAGIPGAILANRSYGI